MKIDPDYREQVGLKKEQDRFLKYAARPGAPQCEVDYFNQLAQNTGAKINWKVLNKGPIRKREERREEYS